MKIKVGDSVIVTSGSDKGSKGRVLKVVLSDKGRIRVVVSGINLRKKRTESGFKSVEMHISASNVAFFDSESGVPTKLGYKMIDGKKVRFMKSSGKVMG